MGPEARWWNRIRSHLPEGTMARRLEVTTGAGMPDVLMTLRGYPVMIELKSLDRFVKTLNVTPIQKTTMVRWTSSGLPCVVFAEVRHEDRIFMASAHDLGEWTRDEWDDRSVYSHQGRMSAGDWWEVWAYLQMYLAEES